MITSLVHMMDSLLWFKKKQKNKTKQKYNKKYKQIDESIYWFDLVLSELQKETSNQIQATLV